MGSAPRHRSIRQVKLFVSTQWVPAGQVLWLGWHVVSDVAVLSIQLASAGESGLEVIESVPNQGRRQLIITRPGKYTFTLSVTFQDGVKRCKQAHVRVER
jgi:hypothetical protein